LITEELIREEFPEFSDATWFGTGIVGVMPKSAVRTLTDTMLRYETELFFKYGEIESAVSAARERIASIISAKQASEICFTRNANEGIIIGLSCMNFMPGDEILTSNQEHGALMDRLTYIKNRGWANIRTFEIHKEPEETLQSAKDQISDKTKLMAFSHVSCQSGNRVPAKEICKAGRDAGAYILIDGAQSVGDIFVNVQDYDCDFYVGNGHKWICGPRGTSFLYVNPDLKVKPPQGFMAYDVFSGDPLERSDATRFEYGTRDRMLLFGLNAVLELYGKWNWQLRDGRIRELSDYIKESLSHIQKCIIHTSLEWEKSSGNTSFSMQGYTFEEVSEKLSKEHISIRGVHELNAIRISTSYFNTHGEIDRLVKALRAM